MRLSRISSRFCLPPPHGRPPGVHMSGVIRAALMAARAWPYEQDGAERSESSQLSMAVGLAWEDWYGPQIPGVVYHPGALFFEGVWFSPDALDLDNLVLHEIKTTTKHEATPRSVLHWDLQLRGYLWALGEGEWRRAVLHVLHVGQPPLPELRIWEVEYEYEELRDTWKTVLSPFIDRAIPET